MKFVATASLGILVAAFVGSCRPHGYVPVPLAHENVEPADNSFCYVCHINYKKEGIVVQHVEAGVGCMKCHGDSDDHSADEDGLTPPEIMFAEGAINTACLKCHREKDADDIVADEPMLEGGVGDRVCTDCHGEQHRLTVRTRRWDKLTGKLTYDDGVRMIGPPGPGKK